MFKVGDEVVCIKKGQWEHVKGPVVNSSAPKYNEDCIVDSIMPDGYLVLVGYNKLICGCFHPERFRKKNPLTKEEQEELENLVITTEGIEKVRELETV